MKVKCKLLLSSLVLTGCSSAQTAPSVGEVCAAAERAAEVARASCELTDAVRSIATPTPPADAGSE